MFKKLFLFLLIVTLGYSNDIVETIYVLKSDGKNAVKYFSSRSEYMGNFTFSFENRSVKQMKKEITYARPSNYSWSNKKNSANLFFPKTGSYAFLQHVDDTKLFRDPSTGYFKLLVDGSSCIGYGCVEDENIISVTIPNNFQVMDYKAYTQNSYQGDYVAINDNTADWKKVGDTYTVYVKNIAGAYVVFSLKQDIDDDYFKVKQSLEQFGIESTIKDDAIKIVAPMDKMFDSGSATLNTGTMQWLDSLIKDLTLMGDATIQVEGHTDNAPMKSKIYPSNWELSGYRATNVLKYMVSKGISPTKICALGFADTKPIASNNTPEGKAKNRRIEISVRKSTSTDNYDQLIEKGKTSQKPETSTTDSNVSTHPDTSPKNENNTTVHDSNVTIGNDTNNSIKNEIIDNNTTNNIEKVDQNSSKVNTSLKINSSESISKPSISGDSVDKNSTNSSGSNNTKVNDLNSTSGDVSKNQDNNKKEASSVAQDGSKTSNQDINASKPITIYTLTAESRTTGDFTSDADRKAFTKKNTFDELYKRATSMGFAKDDFYSTEIECSVSGDVCSAKGLIKK